MANLQVEAEKAELQLKELKVRRLMCARGDDPWYQYPAIDKALIDHFPKATPDNLSFISLNIKYIIFREK
uniref:NADH dehydrogenase [ubiquinone] 1 beta subcomplex subunit 5, mitochondrial n=1 Tax=Catagonus wagneri TaxID=51154 RepID=A0A8C3YSQ6_9CETA